MVFVNEAVAHLSIVSLLRIWVLKYVQVKEPDKNE